MKKLLLTIPFLTVGFASANVTYESSSEKCYSGVRILPPHTITFQLSCRNVTCITQNEYTDAQLQIAAAGLEEAFCNTCDTDFEIVRN
jgi:aspartate carbamoyltransferase regulatory subunit